MARAVCDWDAIMKEMSSGEDSDEHDTPNIVSLQKNLPRIVQLVQEYEPAFRPEQFIFSGAPKTSDHAEKRSASSEAGERASGKGGETPNEASEREEGEKKVTEELSLREEEE